MAFVRTTAGAHVTGIDPTHPRPGKLTPDEAEADAKERNLRAEALGIKARYEAAFE